MADRGEETAAGEGLTAVRGVALAALVLVVIVVAYLLLRGGTSYQYHLLFQNAGQLVSGDQVQVGGVPVGSVNSIGLTADNQASITVSVSNQVAPLHEGTTATIRATSLSGIANRYVAIFPGPNSAPQLATGSVLPADRTTSIVDLDQLIDTLNAPTRHSLQQVIQGSAESYAGEQANANRAARYFNPLLGTSQRLIGELLADQQVFTNFLVSSSRTVTALAARSPQLADLVSSGDATFGAIASQNAALSQGLQLLAPTLRLANTTFVNLRSTLGDLTNLVNVSKPATRNLTPFLIQLRPLVATAVPTVRDLNALLYKPGPNNDLVDIVRKLPALQRVLKPAAADSVTALSQSQPVLSFIRPYTPELEGWIRDFGEGANSYDANGHYARISPIFDLFDFSPNPSGGLLTAVGAGGTAGLQLGRTERCPGAAIQSAADNSNPFTDSGALDCQPSQVPPGTG